MISFFRKYPARYYWRTLFRKPSDTTVVVSLYSERGTMLIKPKGRGLVKYVADIHKYPGAPSPMAPAQRNGAFRSLLSANGVRRGGRFLFVPAQSDIELCLLGQEALVGIETVKQLRATSSGTLHPTFDRHQSFEWDFLSPTFSRLTDTLPSTVLLVGMPTKLRRWCEAWTEGMGGRMIAIVPALAAALSWTRTRTDSVVLLLGQKESHLAVFQNGELKLLEAQSAFASILKSPETLADKIRDLGSELAEMTVAIFRGDVPPLKARELSTRLESVLAPIHTTLLEPTADETERVKGAEGALDAYVMEALVR
jgi:hypothetical protein